MKPDELLIAQPHAAILSTNKVLRNTYMLLSMTLLFSAAMAAVAMALNIPALHPLLVFGGAIGLLLLTNACRNSTAGLGCVFLFTGFMGFTLGPMLNLYLYYFANGTQLILTALGGTGVIFLALSGYVLTSRKDFTFMGGFLFVGVLVLILASLAALFLPIPGLQLALSCMAILIFSGLILYDTSRIIHGGETNYIMATVALYLDIYNIFVNLLHLFGAFAGDD